MSKHPRKSSGQRMLGMTLVELLLAMSITSMVTLAAGGMLTAVSYGSSERTDLRGMVVRQELIAHRLSAVIRASRQVLDCDNNELVLWVTDANNDQTPQLSEVRWIERDTDKDEINKIQLVFPSSWTQEIKDAADKDYVAGSARAVQTATLTAHVQTERWADKTTDWLISPGSSTASLSTLVSYRVTFTVQGKEPQTIVGAAALRSQ